jgi:HPr kinase/phosphorylase
MSSTHASAILIGEKALLITGVSGSGKSRLVLRILQDNRYFTRLIGDDRVFLRGFNGRLIVSPALPGLLEVRGQGVVTLPFEAAGVVAACLQLECETAQRMPEKHEIFFHDIKIPLFKVKKGCDPLPLLYSLLDVGEI